MIVIYYKKGFLKSGVGGFVEYIYNDAPVKIEALHLKLLEYITDRYRKVPGEICNLKFNRR